MNYNDGNCSQFPGKKSAGDEPMSSFPGYDSRQIPLVFDEDLRTPLFNLTHLNQKMESLQQFLSESIDRNILLGKDQMDMVSTEISSAINQIIVNGTAMIGGSTTKSQSLERGKILMPESFVVDDKVDLMPYVERSNTCSDSLGFSTINSGKTVESSDLGIFDSIKPDLSLISEKIKEKRYLKDEIDDKNCEIIELEAVELLAEHIHVCEICGKGFKRDANLRMHMRAHGNQYKTPEALAKPEKSMVVESIRKIRFSCPFIGCNRNKSHKKFRPLKSSVCVKNHFRRSHCPKMYSCNRCNKKSFSVLADLKSHLKHCGESKWKCSCGTTFSRKDKLFGHIALFEGHMPAITEEIQKPSKKIITVMEEEEDDEETLMGEEQFGFDQGLIFDGWEENFGSIVDEDCFNSNVFDSPVLGSTEMEGWFDL